MNEKLAIFDWDYIQKSIHRGMPDLKINDYFKLKMFLHRIFEHKRFKDHTQRVTEIESRYNLRDKVIIISILLESELGEYVIDLSGIGAHSEAKSLVSNKCSRKNNYYLNFNFKIEEISEMLNKLSNLDKSELGTVKFNL